MEGYPSSPAEWCFLLGCPVMDIGTGVLQQSADRSHIAKLVDGGGMLHRCKMVSRMNGG